MGSGRPFSPGMIGVALWLLAAVPAIFRASGWAGELTGSGSALIPPAALGEKIGVFLRPRPRIPFLPGEKLVVRLRWGALRIGEIEARAFADEMPAGGEVVRLAARVVINFWSVQKRVELTSLVEPSGFSPLRFERLSEERDELCREILQYDPLRGSGYFSRKRWNEKTGEISRDVREEIPLPGETQNSLSVFYYLRILDWSKGPLRRITVIDHKDEVEEWICRFSGPSRLPGGVTGKRAALKIEIGITRQQSGERWAAAIWFSDDGEKRPLRFEITGSSGSLTAELVAVEELAAARTE